MDDKILNYYKLAIMIKMDAESIPEDVVRDMLGEHYLLYEKAKEKNEDFSRFLLGMLFSFGAAPESIGSALVVMAYLGLEEYECDD